jgi:hypothetical protein
MYANIKCYFHPKDDSTDNCKGCKLPLCVSCNGWEGFCRECIEKRRAVHQLKQLRTVAASKVAATTTGRLRLAMHEAGPAGTRRGPGPLVPPPSPPTAPLMGTRPLHGAHSPSRMLPPEPAPQPRRAGMVDVSYKPVDVSYKPATQRAPQSRHGHPAPKAKAPVRPVAKAEPITLPAWAVPFAAGIGVGIVIVLLMTLTHHHPRPKPKPLYQGLSRHEATLAKQLLGADTPPTIALSEGSRADEAPQVGWSGR